MSGYRIIGIPKPHEAEAWAAERGIEISPYTDAPVTKAYEAADGSMLSEADCMAEDLLARGWRGTLGGSWTHPLLHPEPRTLRDAYDYANDIGPEDE